MQTAFKTKSFILALLIIIGLIFLNLPNIRNQIKDFFYSGLAPVQKKADHAAKEVGAWWSIIRDVQKLFDENLELKQEVQELKAKNTKLQEVKQENKFLQSSLNLTEKTDYDISLATIIGRGFQGMQRYILVNKGSLAAIEKNMPVVVFDNILVGKITEVFKDSAKVLLITSPNSKIPALIQESRIQGLVSGTKKESLSMDSVSKDLKVETGNKVITSGLDGIFPKGMLVGEVSEVKIFEHKMFQQITLNPAVNLEELEQVFIIKIKK